MRILRARGGVSARVTKAQMRKPRQRDEPVVDVPQQLRALRNAWHSSRTGGRHAPGRGAGFGFLCAAGRPPRAPTRARGAIAARASCSSALAARLHCSTLLTQTWVRRRKRMTSYLASHASGAGHGARLSRRTEAWVAMDSQLVRRALRALNAP